MIALRTWCDLLAYVIENASEPGIVAGFFNGAEGDVSPDWHGQDRSDVLTLGMKLADAVKNILTKRPDTQSQNVKVVTSWNRAKQGSEEWRTAGFSEKPMPGAGEVGGAEDGRTLFYNYGFRGEVRNKDTNSQDAKVPALKQPLKDLVDGLELSGVKPLLGILGIYNKPDADSFPLEFPVARVSLEPVANFAAIPVEATTLVGRAIRERLGRQTILLGLSNEYYGYTVTYAEYGLQQYEGGSTELGPDEATGILYLLEHVRMNASKETVEKQIFRPGRWREQEFGPDLPLLRVPRNTIDDDLQPLYPMTLQRLESQIPRFEWTENSSGDRRPEARRVSIFAGRLLVATDRTSSDFLTVFDGTSAGLRIYDALWVAPSETSSKSYFFFRVNTADGWTVCSEPFQVEFLPATAPPTPIAKAKECPQ